MPLSLFNTWSRRKERFTPKCPPHVGIYTCGPTVYDFAHIGNLRTYVFEDILCRFLRTLGFAVQQIMNLTDVDDKTLKGAKNGGQTLAAFTAPYKAAFFEDLAALQITPAAHYPEATAYIPQMIAMIEELMARECAYMGEDRSVYFSIARFEPYGRLAHFCPHQLQVGATNRMRSDEYDKLEASDFVLWKAYDLERDGAIYWNSPWGRGRPGWHIECSAMARHYLGETLDIHAGGVDNIFPHHENEIAQSESIANGPLARFWLHSEHLRVEGRKMAKSAGNFFTLSDLTKRGVDPLAFRMLLLQTHYRTQLNFTWPALNAAQSALQRLRDLIARLEHFGSSALAEGIEADEGIDAEIMEMFHKSLCDDLNTSGALAVVFDWARELNRQLDAQALKRKGAQGALKCLREMDRTLGLLFTVSSTAVPKEVLQLSRERQLAREQKQWKRSDELRDAIRAYGFLVEDSAQGPRLKPASPVA